MIIFRIIFSIILIPLLLFLYVLKLFFYVWTLIGGKIILFLGGLVFLGGLATIVIPILATDDIDFAMSLPLIFGGLGICALPYVDVAIVAGLNILIGLVQGFLFG